MQLNSSLQPASYLRRLIAFLIDGGLIVIAYFIFLGIAFTNLVGQFQSSLLGSASDANPLLVVMLLFITYRIVYSIYRFVCYSLFQKTLGMAITQLSILNAQQEPLNSKEKLYASFLVLKNGVDYYEKTDAIGLR